MKRLLKTASVLLLVCAVIVSASACSIVYPVTSENAVTKEASTAYESERDLDAAESEGITEKIVERQSESTKEIVSETFSEEETTHPVVKREEILSQIPHYQTRYYISQFDGELLDNFAKLYIATRDHEKSCSFISKVTKDELDALIFALKYDCPELFCLDNIKTYYQEGDGERNITRVNIDYLMSEEAYLEKLEEAERTIQQIINMATEDAYGKRLAVYEFLTNNCNYNLNTLNCGNAYGALVEKQTKCDGISLAYMWILEELGENCFVVAGTMPGDTQGHGWNVVKQGDKYYASDLTADLSNVFLSGKRGNWYPAFNVSTDWVENLYTSSETPAFFKRVTNDDMTQSYHVHNESFCTVYDDEYQWIYYAIAEAADSEEYSSLIQFETDEMYEYFLNEYGNIVATWAEDNECMNVEYTYGSMEEYRTVRLMIKADVSEDIEQED